MTSLCHTCRTAPAGNGHGGPHSAYCAGCQPVRTGPRPTPTQHQCAPCGAIFATLTDFDAHQPGTCQPPAMIGLTLRGHVWGTPEGNADRDRRAARMPRPGRHDRK